MLTVCAWCDRYLGGHDAAITHGICTACTARQHWHDTPVLVVSREREGIIPVLRHLLHGIPEVKIVLERRRDERRQAAVAPAGDDRRSGGDRRRHDDLVLL
jgi:hypothetical protein